MQTRIAAILPVLTAVVIAGCGGRGAQGVPAATNPTPCPRATPNDLLRSPSTRLLSVAASSAMEVWAVGSYSDGSNVVEHTLADHWNGRTWSTIRTPNTDCGISNELRSVAISNANDVWAVGVVTDGHGGYQPLTEHWDGSSWSIVATPAVPGRDGQLNAVTVIRSRDAWAVGSYVTGDGASTAPQTLTEHWDGQVWSVVPSPNRAGVESSLRAVVAATSRDVWAGGRTGTYLPQAPLLLHWDGASWSTVSGAPPPPQMFGRWVGADVVGLSARGPRDVWAVGSFFDESGSSGYTLAEHWDGSSWSLVPVDAIIPSPSGHYFQAVTSFSSTDAWAVDPNLGINHWDGARWAKVAGAAPNALLYGIVGSGPADIWVVGDYSLIEHWNGSGWAVVPPPPPAWPTPRPLTG